MSLAVASLPCGTVACMATTSGRRLAPAPSQLRALPTRRSLVCRAESEGQEPSAPQQPPAATPSPPTPDDDEPIWVRRERERELMKKEGGGDLPFGVYLVGSAIVAIAAVGSIFEYAAKNPIFDVIEADSPLYTPILGFFAITGLPSAGFLFYKAVSAANKEAERMDKLDGY